MEPLIPPSLDSRVHHHILSRILKSGHAPDVEELAASLSVPVPDVEQSLRRLEEGHGLVLHPASLPALRAPEAGSKEVP